MLSGKGEGGLIQGPSMSMRYMLGLAGCVAVIIFLTLNYLTGWAAHPIVSRRIVADYEDHFSVMSVDEIEVEEDKKWKKAICPIVSQFPSFPIRLPPFDPDVSRKNIFFLETTCATTLNAKMACAVESAAKHHPDQDVHLALTTTHISGSDHILDVLMSFPNIHLSFFNPATSLPSSHPLVKWLKSGQWANKLEWASVVLSDVVRLVVVCWAGGTYLDLDLLFLASFPTDFAWVGREQWNQISNGAFSLPRDHWLCRSAQRELMNGFDENLWGSSGPKALHKALTRACRTNNFTMVTQCGDLTLLAPEALYPIYYKAWESIFTPRPGGEEWERPEENVALHLWNRFSAMTPLRPGDGSIIDQVAQNNCPKIYRFLRNVNRHRQRLRYGHKKQPQPRV